VKFSEQEILREEIQALQATKEKLKTRVSELEDELKKVKEQLEKEKAKSSGQAEDEVCLYRCAAFLQS
jgi:predicted  nucleic acid-binding Zn-ribbon protein